MDCYLKCIESEIRLLNRGRYLSADNKTTEGVDDERDLDESGVCLDVRRVSDPEAVGRRRGEVVINKIIGSVRQFVTDRGLSAPAAPNALDTELLHQPLKPCNEPPGYPHD